MVATSSRGLRASRSSSFRMFTVAGRHGRALILTRRASNRRPAEGPWIRRPGRAAAQHGRGSGAPRMLRPLARVLGSIDYPTDCPATRAADSQSGRVVAGLVSWFPSPCAGESTSAVAAPCPAAAGTSPTRRARRASLRWWLMCASRHWLEHDCALALR
jgi:hypothetical protein